MDSHSTPGQAGQRFAYQRSTDFRWTKRAFELLETGALSVEFHPDDNSPDHADVTGDCPRCAHRIQFQRTLTAVLDQGTRGLQTRPDPVAGRRYTIDVVCSCTVDHEDAPPNVTGCGAVFRIEVEAAPS